jgi:plastocyanin
MQRNKGSVWAWVIIIIAIILIGWWWSKSGSSAVPPPSATSTDQVLPDGGPAAGATMETGAGGAPEAGASAATGGLTQPQAATVTYTDTGFSPNDLSIHQGDTVTWVNNSTHNMWVASGMHPSHTGYSGTTMQTHCPDTTESAFDECAAVAPGGSWSFTFDKVGSWAYHNHNQASDFGKVTVQ